MMYKRYFLIVAVSALLAQLVRTAHAESSARLQEDVVELDPLHTDIDFVLPGYLHTTHGHLTGDQMTASCDFLVPYTEWGLHSPNVLSPTQIINSIRRSNSGFVMKTFPIFAYVLPALRRIPPNLFWVSDLVDIKVETKGHIIWAAQSEARKVTVIVPQD